MHLEQYLVPSLRPKDNGVPLPDDVTRVRVDRNPQATAQPVLGESDAMMRPGEARARPICSSPRSGVALDLEDEPGAIYKVAASAALGHESAANGLGSGRRPIRRPKFLGNVLDVTLGGAHGDEQGATDVPIT